MANTKIQENKENIDLNEIKEELTDYINIQIKKNFNEEWERANKILIKEKNKKIFIKNIEIIILLCLICFLSYLLYNNHYFDKYFNSDTTNNEVSNNNINNESNEEKVILEGLISKYHYLVDTIIINEKSSYIEDYYKGNLTGELKNYLTINTMNLDELTIEDDCNLIDNSLFIESYNKLFKENYESSSFDYNGVKVRYFQKLESYITDSILETVPSNVKKEIINIEVNDNEIIITTLEGIVIDNKLYNILSSEEITSYKNDSFTNYENNLNKVVYTFQDNKLVSIK